MGVVQFLPVHSIATHDLLHRVASLYDTACLTPADMMIIAMQTGMALTPRVLFTLLALVRLLGSPQGAGDLTSLAWAICWISPVAQQNMCQHLTGYCRACSARV